jgi:large subunit ribosomal protein L25
MATTKVTLEVEARSGTGTGPNRRLRRSGRVPGNVYGLNMDSFAISVDPRRVEELLRSGSGRNTILTLSMKGAGESRDVMIREIQRQPVSDGLRHVDFMRLDATRKMEARVPVNIVGVATGVKNDGGVLDFIHREVTVLCLPSAIPEHLDADVTELHIGQHLEVKDLVLPAEVELVDEPNMVLVVIAQPKAEEEETAAGEEEAAEVAGEAAKPAVAPEDGDS